MFLDIERQSRDRRLPWGPGSLRDMAEETKTQSKWHQEEERVSLKTTGWVQTDVIVHMATWTHLETPAPPPRWGQSCLGHVLSVVILFLFLQSCTKVKSHQGPLVPTYLRKNLGECFGTEAHALERPLQDKVSAASVAWLWKGILASKEVSYLQMSHGLNSTIRAILFG